MAVFRLREKSDVSITEMLAMNIDEDHNVLTRVGSDVYILPLSDFKDMVLGTHADSEIGEAAQPTHEVID